MRRRIKKITAAILCGVGFGVLTLAAAAQKSSFRSLTVVTEPEAMVWIDDVNYGKTDASGKLVLKTFSTGTHKIRVRANGLARLFEGTGITVPQSNSTALADYALGRGEAQTRRTACDDRAPIGKPRVTFTHLNCPRCCPDRQPPVAVADLNPGYPE